MTISPLAINHGVEVPAFTFPPSDRDSGSVSLSPDQTRHTWESKRREAVWDLFQSESAFLRDHLMSLKNVVDKCQLLSIFQFCFD